MFSEGVIHRSVHYLIEKSPFLNIHGLRLYNRLLRTFGTTYLAKTYFGSIMRCDPRDLIQHMILHFGVWEPNISRIIENRLQPGDVFLDVGANVGYDTLLASKRVGNAGKVISIEASPAIFQILQNNLKLNAVHNVRTVNKAASDRPGVLNLYSGPATNIGQSTTLASRNFTLEAQVSALPVDEILSAEELSRLRLIKIDIEGGEIPVMHRFIETIDLYPDNTEIIVEVAPLEEWDTIFQQMSGLGFSAFGVENSYDRYWYLKHRHQLAQPTKIASLPDKQIDVLFSRQGIT